MKSEAIKSLDEKIIEATEMAEINEGLQGTETYTIKLQIQIDKCRGYMKWASEPTTGDNNSNSQTDERFYHRLAYFRRH